MTKTRKGVYHDLTKSTYFYILGDITYYFSSEFNRDRFVRDYQEERNKISKSLTNRFKIDINAFMLADIITYKSIEKRGFHIVKGGVVLCERNLKLGTELKINSV